VNDLNTARYGIGGDGISTAALAFGGIVTAATGTTETWNGTSWSQVDEMNTGRFYPGGAGTNTSALAFGGEGPPISGATEEFDDPSLSNKTVTAT